MAVDENRERYSETEQQVGLIGVFPAVSGSVRQARDAAAEIAERHGARPGCVDDVRLAVSEAATNVVMHAYEQDAAGDFRLLAIVNDEQILVVVEDDGSGLSAPARTPGLGAGLGVMKQVADQARFRERDSGGSTVQLGFKLATERRS